MSGNPGGSLEATRRAFNKDFLLALTADFKKHGASAIEKVRKEQPAAYMKICALLVPREMRVEHTGGVKSMTDEELERGIEAIQSHARRSGRRSDAKMIEAVGSCHRLETWRVRNFVGRGARRRGDMGTDTGSVPDGRILRLSMVVADSVPRRVPGAPTTPRAPPPPPKAPPHPPAREKLFHQGPFPIRCVFFCFWPLAHWSCC